eukprot:5175488-Lingulodinium_polyedra.AAC.1
MLRLGPAGHCLTDYLMKLFTGRGFPFTSTAVRGDVREVKEPLGYMVLDFYMDMNAATGSESERTRSESSDKEKTS